MALGYRHLEGLDVPKICSTAALNFIEVAKFITEIYSSGMPQAVELIRLNLDQKKNKKMMSEGRSFSDGYEDSSDKLCRFVCISTRSPLW